jgi:hypothetical protein
LNTGGNSIEYIPARKVRESSDDVLSDEAANAGAKSQMALSAEAAMQIIMIVEKSSPLRGPSFPFLVLISSTSYFVTVQMIISSGIKLFL